MIARRLIATLALIALVHTGLAFARPTEAGGSSGSEGHAYTLVALRHETAGLLTRILIESSAPPLYTVYRPSDRLIVVDFPGGEGSKLASEYSVKSSLVDSIAVRQSSGMTAAGPLPRGNTRIEIAVRENCRDRSSLDGNSLVIEVSPEATDTAPTSLPVTASDVKGADTRSAAANASAPYVNVHPVPVSATRPSVKPDPALSQPSTLKSATVVRSVRPESVQGGFRVVVDTDGNAAFKDFVLPNPWRIVVDINGVRSAMGNKTFPVNSDSVLRVRVGQPGPDAVRVVLDAKSKLQYQVTREGASLVISVGSLGSVAEAGKHAAAVQPASKQEVKVAGEKIEQQSGSKTQTTPQASAKTLAKAADSRSNVPPARQPETGATPPARATSNLPSVPRETIIQPVSSTARPSTDVKKPSSATPAAQTAPTGQETPFCDPNYVGGMTSFDLRAGVDIRDMLRFISQQYGVNFIVDKSVGSVPVDIRVTDIPWNQVMQSVLRANRLGSVCESGGRIIRIATLPAIKEEEEQQRAIREEIAKKEPLETKIISLKYARAVGTLGAAGSGSSGRGGTSVSSGVSGGAGGQARGTLLSIAEKRLSPRGRIEMDLRTNSLIVTDAPEYIQAVENIIAQLDQPEPQVEIEARIVIASRNFLRDIGTELAGAAANNRRGRAGILETSPVQFRPGGLTSGSGSDSGGGGSGDQTNPLGPNLVGPLATEALRGGAASTVLSLTTGFVGTGILSAALTASETKGQIRTIASPRITAQDNQTAEIVNGVQIPVQTVSNNTVTTTFVTAALRLEITPQIIEETGEVLMKVVAENNTVNFALANQFNNGTPGINTQSAESIVRVQDGGTTVMGGINIDTEGHSQNRTPGISRIPLVGELFKRRTTRRDFDEILFFVTPRIVRGDGSVGPTAPQRSAVEPGSTTPTTPQRAAADPGQKASQPAPAQASAQPNAGKGGR